MPGERGGPQGGDQSGVARYRSRFVTISAPRPCLRVGHHPPAPSALPLTPNAMWCGEGEGKSRVHQAQVLNGETRRGRRDADGKWRNRQGLSGTTTHNCILAASASKPPSTPHQPVTWTDNTRGRVGARDQVQTNAMSHVACLPRPCLPTISVRGTRRPCPTRNYISTSQIETMQNSPSEIRMFCPPKKNHQPFPPCPV